VNKDQPVSALLEGVAEGERIAAIARLHDLFSGGELSLECFSDALERVLAAPNHADLVAAMLALPPLVPLTLPSLRLAKPLVLRAADGGLQLGSGWQLAADTTISTGFGLARLDLTVASWDAHQVHLRLQTWGSMEVLVPQGVAVQMVGGSAHVQLESLAPPVPGGPVLRVSTSGPTGVIQIRHPKNCSDGRFTRWRQRHTPGSRSRADEPHRSHLRP
jgi:hypothetical protein